MSKLARWYKNTKLSTRVIFSMNVAIFVSILIISIFAVLNRQRVQKNEAKAHVNTEINQLINLLSFASDTKLEDFSEVIKSKSLYNTGFISIVNSSGRVLICNRRENQDISGTDYYRHMRQNAKSPTIYTDPVTQKINYQYFEYYEPLDIFIMVTLEKSEFIDKPVRNTLMIMVFALLFTWITFSLVNYFIMKTVTVPITGLVKVVNQLGKGDLPERYDYNYKDEVGQMARSVNEFVDGLKQTAIFAQEIGKNNFEHPFQPLSENDVLGNALLDMRKSLKTANDEEILRKKEDEKRNWTTQGLARFGDILRQNNDNLQELSYNIIRNLVDYLQINQGGIFIINEQEKEGDKKSYLELTACYAFDRRKYLEKKILVGEGLVGTCYLEKETIYMTNIPQDYIRITSGLGDENPSALLLVPLKLNDEIFGIIELASFHDFEKYRIEFVEKIGESIASTISAVKINSQTAMLLQKSQQQAEEMRAQEEEMRQNMEELTATQEAMAEKEKDNLQTIALLNEENKKRQDSFQAKDKELLTTLEDCPDSVVKYDSTGQILIFNKASEKLWGYQRKEVVGGNIQLLFPEKKAKDISAHMLNPLSGKEKSASEKGRTIEIRRKNGDIQSVFSIIVETESEEQSYFTGFFKDLNEIEQNTQDIPPVGSESKSVEPTQDDPKPVTRKRNQSKSSTSKDERVDDLHKAEETDNQKAWSQHMDQKGKQFKKGRKK